MREDLVTDDIKGIIKGKAVNLPGFNNSFDFNRSQDSITAKLLANTVSSPKKLGNNLLMPEINLMLNGKALIDQSAAHLSPWDGRVEYVTKRSSMPSKTPVKLISGQKKPEEYLNMDIKLDESALNIPFNNP